MKLLFIDDDSIINSLHEIFLEELEVETHQYKIWDSPMEAIKMLATATAKSVPYEILFLDINMPKMTGWDVLEELTTLEIKIPHIYILSTSASHKDIQRAKEHPLVTDFIPKPLELEDLEKYVSSVLVQEQ